MNYKSQPRLNKALKVLIFFALSLASVVLVSGFWPMPNIGGQYEISQSLGHNPFTNPAAHYIYTNYLQPAIFGILGGKSPLSYAIYAAATTLVFLLVFIFWFIQYHGYEIAINQAKILAAVSFTVFAMPFYWIGMDGLTLLLMLSILISNSKHKKIIFAVLLGLQHFEQGLIGFSILAGSLLSAAILTKDKTLTSKFKEALLLISGIAIGKLILFGWFFLNDIKIDGDRTSYLKEHLGLFTQMWVNNWMSILISLMGAGWIIALRNAVVIWPLFLSIIIVFFLTLIVGDQTRVGTIILFPSLFYWLLQNREIWKNMTQSVSAGVISLHLIAPFVIVWGGTHYGLLDHSIQLTKDIFVSKVNLAEINMLQPYLPKNPEPSASSTCKYFPGNILPSQTGENKGSEIHYNPEKNKQGFLTFGPFISLKKGSYTAIIRYSSISPAQTEIGWIDVATEQGTKTLIRRKTYGTNSVNETIQVNFFLDESTNNIEVRFWHDGKNEIKFKDLEIHQHLKN